MDNFSAPFSTTTTNPSTTTIATTSIAQQDMGHPQNVHFPDNSGPFVLPSTPSRIPVTQFHFPPPYLATYRHTFQPHGYPFYSSPMGQSSDLFRMQNSQLQGWSQPMKEERKKMEAWMCRIARDRRKQARQRSRSSASGATSVPEGTIRGQRPGTFRESNVKVTVTQNRSSYVFYAPDGKRLEEILTKKLKKSDIGTLGRIVLPKREAEEKLPALWDKDGIDVVVKDVYSELRWSLKYKYWSNNKSRMYVLENTGDLVNHYELQMGDSVTLYEDEVKNLYVSTKKERNVEVPVLSSIKEEEEQQTHGGYNYSHMHNTPYTHQANDDEEEASLALLIKELSHHHKKEEAAANSFLTLCNGEASFSSGRQYDKIAQHQVASQETIASSLFKDQTIVIDHDQQNSFDDVYENLDNSLEVECNYLLVDHLTDENVDRV